MVENIPPNIHQRIINIMSELKYIQKGNKQVNGQYRFVSHDQVTAAIHPYLVKHGITVVPTIEEYAQEGNRTTIKLAVVFVNADNPNDNLTVRFIGFGCDSGDKGPGKAVSYAYKYALLKTFCLETGDDPDQDQNARYEPVKCLEFDEKLPEMTSAERKKLDIFLEYSAKAMDKHVEDVKREALKRMPDFINGFKKWNNKKKED